MNLKNKKVLVIGLAITGVPLVKTLLSLGATVIVNDLKPEETLAESLKELEGLKFQAILGKHPESIEELGNLDLAVVSPGVPLDIPFIKKLKETDIEIIGEIELAYRLNKAPIVAITGTNGKTTTTALTGEIFRRAKKNTFVVGNIGVAAISKALETTEKDVMVMEVSSFQLESVKEFRPKVAAILNLTPDHLNRHKTMENYQSAKFNLFKNQGPNDYAVINYDDSICRKASEGLSSKKLYFSRKVQLSEGVFVENNHIVISYDDRKEVVINIEDIKIPGLHNLENALAATAMAFLMGVEIEVIRTALMHFKGVVHRIEYVDTIKGVHFINDSKATNTDAAIKAIEAVNPPIILLAGGLDKASEFEDFIQAFNQKVKHVFAYGETAEKIYATAEKLAFHHVTIVKDLEEAASDAYAIAKEEDTILLSPACASWDMYRNFEERGDHFKKIVANLRRS
ncbi:UDP-N-acetylmuramoyl-L-alanine--D-glutamate ligase [Clostridium formicaceticum]|uniref:UDP-N-acetylmuramoylalanine--D-glutamate ligase n=1 Tax=Clostridium formicaceticum TaxID=1497 RepID=A0AAC9RLP9_9CLOT|nr:UDP-N-acetylmuramoyl-L-alanine--D-glutamate ligase [Clostridium formicaceticum]AOY77430.1 UDP-N-acetylmuramoylalanine--D-glutamate ligase [Clostridium formicaceticum]ARE87984.1 UDP-N-acetylmuramoylalanine--D-glutamate ligase [Clostridium formicaceticum]